METGSRIRPFSLPSFLAFTRDPMFTEVALGTVTETHVVVGETDDVQTVITIQVDRARDAVPGTLLTAREPGGVVRFEQVADSFRGHLTEDEILKRKDELIDYQTEGSSHSQVGDRLLLVLGGGPSDPGGRYVATALRRTADGSYAWSGAKPNAAWRASFAGPDLNELLAR